MWGTRPWWAQRGLFGGGCVGGRGGSRAPQRAWFEARPLLAQGSLKAAEQALKQLQNPQKEAPGSFRIRKQSPTGDDAGPLRALDARVAPRVQHLRRFCRRLLAVASGYGRSMNEEGQPLRRAQVPRGLWSAPPKHLFAPPWLSLARQPRRGREGSGTLQTPIAPPTPNAHLLRHPKVQLVVIAEVPAAVKRRSKSGQTAVHPGSLRRRATGAEPQAIPFAFGQGQRAAGPRGPFPAPERGGR